MKNEIPKISPLITKTWYFQGEIAFKVVIADDQAFRVT